MDTSKLIIGQEFKNYKVLCEALGEKCKTGKSKQLQLQDWQRFFEWEKSGNTFIITDIFEIPKPKRERTSNNIKNIEPMIKYLKESVKTAYLDVYMTFSYWYCDVLEILNREACNEVYGTDEEIEDYCKEHRIEKPHLLKEFVSLTKSELKNMFLKSLRYLHKKNDAEFLEGYIFYYTTSLRHKERIGYIATNALNDIIIENETNICNEMNQEFHLSPKLKGRQNLLVIYNKQELYEVFEERKTNALMENEDALLLLNNEIEDEYGITAYTIDEKHPIQSYYKGIRIISIEESTEELNAEALAVEITNTIRRKVRKKLYAKSFTEPFHCEKIYPYIYSEEDMKKIEQLLFCNCDGSDMDFVTMDIMDDGEELCPELENIFKIADDMENERKEKNGFHILTDDDVEDIIKEIDWVSA